MAIRNILDHTGAVIGQLELPSETSEDVWQEKLAHFAKPPAVVIPDVSPRQMRCALILSGISIATVDEALNGLPEPTRSLAITEWEYSLSFERNRPLVDSVSSLLGWSSEQVDELWKLAASL